MMNWTQKEASLLKDLKQQEQLCVDKYTEYARRANDPELQQLFSDILATEQQHLRTVQGMLDGKLPQTAPQGGRQQQNAPAAQAPCQPPAGMTLQQAMDADRYLCQDALCTEKEVSGAYDTSIFEFRDPAARQALNAIQSAEQRHGEMIYRYMAQNGMYQAQ